MKRKIVFIILCILFMIEIFYLQFSRIPTICDAITSSDSTVYELTLTISMNKIVIFNKEEAKHALINRILNNEFKNMQFSYDVMGYPKAFNVTIYTNNFTKKLGIPAFSFRYAPD